MFSDFNKTDFQSNLHLSTSNNKQMLTVSPQQCLHKAVSADFLKGNASRLPLESPH